MPPTSVQDIQLSANFWLSEFLASPTARRYNKPIVPSPDDVFALRRLCTTVLQPVRDHTGPLRITSGIRPPWLNTLEGGSPTSSHLWGGAADVESADWSLTPTELYELVKKLLLPIDQCILEFPPDGWVHLATSKAGRPLRHEYLIARMTHGRKVYEKDEDTNE